MIGMLAVGGSVAVEMGVVGCLISEAQDMCVWIDDSMYRERELFTRKEKDDSVL